MSGLLVLGAAVNIPAWGKRMCTHGCQQLETLPETASTATDTVLIVNDHTEQAAACLDWALELRRSRPDVSVAVLTIVPTGCSDGEALATAMRIPEAGPEARVPAEQARAFLRTRLRTLRVKSLEGGVTFEYSG